MFTNLRIKNFKAWGEQLWGEGVDLAPITLFLGRNSAGKTSLLQPLLLLQQTFASPDRSLDIYLGGKRGDLLDLGTYEQVVHGHDVKAELAFALRLADVSRSVYPLDEDNSPDYLNPRTVEAELHYDVAFGHASGAPHLKQLRYQHGDLTAMAARTKLGTYQLTVEGEHLTLPADSPPPPKREFKPENAVQFSRAADIVVDSLRCGLDDLAAELAGAVGRVQYLGPLRERPQTTYIWGGQEPGIIGSRGEDAVPALLANLNAKKKAERGKVVKEVSRWLREMGVADELHLEQVGGSRFYEVMLTTAGKKANLVHVGFGVSQVLPIIVLALTAPEGSTIIAEQPEIHLHPAAQAVLANLLTKTARDRGLQFLIETHSEHLFRRLQFLVASGEVPKEACRLYFLDRAPSGDPKLEALQMDEFGRIGNWPNHFFGDAVGETERQMERIMERMMAKAKGHPDGGHAR